MILEICCITSRFYTVIFVHRSTLSTIKQEAAKEINVKDFQKETTSFEMQNNGDNAKWKMTQMFIVYFSLRFPYCLSVKALQVISFTNVRYIYLVNQDQMY